MSGEFRGFNVRCGSQIDYSGLRAIGANWIALVVECEQKGTEIECPTTDAAVAADIARARAAGLKVMLKPHIQTREFAWRGEIHFRTAREWAHWWDAYRTLVFRNSRLRADAFVVGTELRQMSAGAQQRVWRDLIQIARLNCACPIMYAANFDEAAQIPWWDAVDIIGIDAYFPLNAPADPRIDDLVHAWQPHKTELGLLASQRGKPVVFTEVGYQSRVSAYLTPWQRDPAILDTEIQGYAYQAVFEAFADAEWWQGALWWELDADEYRMGFSPADKPAMGVLIANWRSAPQGKLVSAREASISHQSDGRVAGGWRHSPSTG